MHSRKSVGPNIVSLGLNILAKSYHPEPPEAVCDREKKKYGQISALKSRRLKFLKKASMRNPVESFRYHKCYSSSSLRPVKSLSSSIRYIDTTAVDREDISENQKKGHISLGDQQSYYLQVFQRLY